MVCHLSGRWEIENVIMCKIWVVRLSARGYSCVCVRGDEDSFCSDTQWIDIIFKEISVYITEIDAVKNVLMMPLLTFLGWFT
jgi:hypothetical protein